MADVRGQTYSSSNCYYDVFLSFRGKDTRKSFIDHLYAALKGQGFQVFRDEDEAEKGENLKSELEKSIGQAKSSILVLSKDYAASPWCLDELVMILDKMKNSELNRLNDPKHWKHEVLPVFYDVKPSHLRNQTGMIAESFAVYEKQIESETDPHKKTDLIDKVKRWRSALTEVADLIGLELRNHDGGYEAKFVQKIVNVIKDKLRKKALDVSPYKVGIESRAKNMNMWVQDGTSDVIVRAISGMGGIGKTTIAKFVYNENFNSFEGSSFLANIREVSQQPNGLLSLQRQLLSDISRKEHSNINSVDEGIVQIKNLLCGRRVLVVLDDVEDKNQLYIVLGMQDWLFPGSKIIITTRHERLLKPHQICRVEKFGRDESIKLFSLHAFGDDRPMQSYIEYTNRVVEICEGLPLALKVIGSALSGKSEDEWIWELEKLEAIPHHEILAKLKISFDSLQDDYDRRLFLHIACFFLGTDKDQAIKILEKCDLYAKIGIQNLVDRCLLEVEWGVNVLEMHKLIRDMAHEVIHQESQDPGERSRLWNHQDALVVLKNETGTKAVEGLVIDMRQADGMRNNIKKRQYEDFSNGSLLSNYVNTLKRHLSSQNKVYLRTEALASMTKLKILGLNYVTLTGNYDNFPKRVAWLSLHGFPLDYLSRELALANVVSLDLRYSRLKQVWKKTPFLESLKILDISYSERLERTPNFRGLPNLERLILKGCVSLVEVCESIGNLEMLEFLDLSDCKALQKLPRNMPKIGSLNMSGCNIVEFRSEVRDLKPLHTIIQAVWSMISTPKKGPQTFWASIPFSLRELDLSNCNLSDDSFPDNFGNMPSLSVLDLSKNSFRRLPNCVKSITGQFYLNTSFCEKLQLLDFDGLQGNLALLSSFNCSSLEKVMSIDHNIRLISFGGCPKLDEVENYYNRSSRELFGMDVDMINNLLHRTNDQITLEFGIINLYRNCGKFSSASGYEKMEGSSICFTVPLLATHSIVQYLNVFCTNDHEIKDDADADAREEFGNIYKTAEIYVKIKNKTKDLTWIYIPSDWFQNRYYNETETWEWWSRWRFGNQLDGGDEITVTFYPIREYMQVNVCGYKIELEEENGEYLLSFNYKHRPDEDYWFPKHSKRFFD